MNRPDWDQYFMEMAVVAAKRSTCNRLQVGCVLVVRETVLCTGFNGAARGLPHCTSEACNAAADGCKNTVHAEANAVAQAARRGHAIEGCTAYVTHLPCAACCGLLINAGIRRVMYMHDYRIKMSIDMARTVGVEMTQLAMGSTVTALDHEPRRSDPPPRAA